MPSVVNLLSDIPSELPAELFETLAEAPGVRIERIVSRGHASDPGFWYDQATRECVLVVSGRARLQFEGEEPFEVRPGDFVEIPAHRKHRVDWTDPDSPTVWLAIHFG